MTVRAKAIAIPRIEDGRLIATEWRMAPGSETGWHRHGKEGPLTASLERGQVTSREAGVEHNVINSNDFEFVFVELELKSRGV
jgi:quercetin dioxygenase-like cupin family protein